MKLTDCGRRPRLFRQLEVSATFCSHRATWDADPTRRIVSRGTPRSRRRGGPIPYQRERLHARGERRRAAPCNATVASCDLLGDGIPMLPLAPHSGLHGLLPCCHAQRVLPTALERYVSDVAPNREQRHRETSQRRRGLPYRVRLGGAACSRFRAPDGALSDTVGPALRCSPR